MISVILPSRLRLESLKRSLDSLRVDLTEEVEVWLAVDEDDPTDYGSVGLLSPYRAQIAVMERFGYPRLHKYYNALAKLAQGEWLLLWNDDAIMATPGWDAVVASYEPNVVLSPSTVHNPLCTFPIVPRRFVEAIGHFSLNAHCDTWWEEVAKELGILEWPEIRVDHQRADVCGMNDDSVYQERIYQTSDFDAMRPTRLADADRIRQLLTKEFA